MVKKLSFIVILMLGWLIVTPQSSIVYGQNTLEPRITAFSTSMTEVSRGALDARTARVPVSWSAEDRPVIANLVFEQILPDGETVNVELPRTNPWVNSSGDGLAAPILPPSGIADEITLVVRLVNFVSGAEYDRETLTLPIVEGDAGSGTTDKPTLVRFVANAAQPLPLEELAAGTLRVPVSWQAINRPLLSTLVFEQRLDDGTWVNVELPRDNPWVNSADSGVVAPVMPGENPDSILLRVRFIDLLVGRVYDQREISLNLDSEPEGDLEINLFSANSTSVDRGELQAGTARVTVLWTVFNRPSYANLVFEQVLANGVVQNVELPRENTWVGSSGSGVVAPVAPTADAEIIQLRLRLVNLDTDETMVSETITLSVTGDGLPPSEGNITITRFDVTPTTTDLTGSATISWEVEGAVRIRIATATLAYENLPLSGYLQAEMSTLVDENNAIKLTLFADTNLESVSTERTVAIENAEPQAILTLFAVTPDTSPANGTITINWSASNFTEGKITWVPDEGINQVVATLDTETGSLVTQQSSEPGDIVFTIHLKDANGLWLKQSITTTATCPYDYMVANPEDPNGDCPSTPLTTIPGVEYQGFENGFVIRDVETRRVYVFFNDGTAFNLLDTWNGDPYTIEGTAPEGLFSPENHIGKIWADYDSVRTGIGWAIAPQATYNMARQRGASSISTFFTLPDGQVARYDPTATESGTWTIVE